ncbi:MULTISPECIES: hypothetical protein [Bacillus]|uniref:hypothetical protein n=2 Tax=Bacillus TaxID=1386 RepID=UPI0001A1033A|nr:MULTISPECIES: hypothetical protein [Bacillus cereus group]EEL84426.1 hypothetical protein bcere0029_58790 [Bacillus cereus AH1272]EEL90549.1 hypothetical protein bcere0030_55070 [Bacillus cereus AH1273]NEL01889.1 hypothetical protein [Bacillus mobilis]HDX9550055.1 hypothetical protein [Bacillus thuringiensis]EKS7862057.1 hypothetical protein [Bacillus cereus]
MNLGSKDLNLGSKQYNGNLSGNEISMLEKISKRAKESKRLNPEIIKGIILELCSQKPLTVNQLEQLLSRSEKAVRNRVNELLREGKLILLFPDNLNHPRQAYMTTEKVNPK